MNFALLAPKKETHIHMCKWVDCWQKRKKKSIKLSLMRFTNPFVLSSNFSRLLMFYANMRHDQKSYTDSEIYRLAPIFVFLTKIAEFHKRSHFPYTVYTYYINFMRSKPMHVTDLWNRNKIIWGCDEKNNQTDTLAVLIKPHLIL